MSFEQAFQGDACIVFVHLRATYQITIAYFVTSQDWLRITEIGSLSSELFLYTGDTSAPGKQERHDASPVARYKPGNIELTRSDLQR